MWKWIICCCLATTVLASFELGKAEFFGSGCPDGTSRLISSTDGHTLSVLFSAYNAETSKTKNRHRLSCNMAVPVTVAPGFSVGLVQVDYRGNAYVPRVSGAYGKFSAEYFFAGYPGVQLTREYESGFDRNIFITNRVEAVSWSQCGASTNFRINTAITAYKPRGTSGETQIAIDSGDARQKFQYKFVSQSC